MVNLRGLVAAIAVTGFMQISYTAANADPSTGHLRNYRPSDAWLAKNTALRVTPEIQASECGMNTRLHFPHVQLFAWHKFNHSEDNFHGCPYGDCYAYTTFPQPEDLEVDYLNTQSFFWHGVGGVPGAGVKAISNPQTGAFGYEKSLSGQYIDGPTPAGTIQTLHDANYPGFHADQLPRWAKGAADRFLLAPEPEHPKCGRPCEPNKDPGMKPGVYGSSAWAPASADKYSPPRGWNLPCPAGSTIPVTDECRSFCKCAVDCKDESACTAQCSRKSHGKCDKSTCPATSATSPQGPQPGNDPDKCANYCSCSQQCTGQEDFENCTKTKCSHISKGCKDHQCSTTPHPPVSSVPDTPGHASGSQKEHKHKDHKKKEHRSGHHQTDGDGNPTARNSRRKVTACA